ncbi:hypothetical protein LPJ61_002210 [Coemansia biformis]|uniref:Nucleoporin Nup133/Nup155-like C-terminal domain-containing protein n=1 Tax=Coemansia biformis TaxID=1286918 RepID=A0A9W7YEY3_9FUNG|nr:hypothetical protein LPJ61_002210 [Coemansia biformis]
MAAAHVRGQPLAAGLSGAGPFAFVATAAECSVWAYGNNGSAGRVHRLAMPDGITEAPVVALVEVADASDVGALVCSATGQLRYWDRVAFGLGGTERFRSGAIALGDTGDRCVQATEVLPGLVVVATAQGRLFRVILGDAMELDAQLLGRGARGGVLGRVSSLLGAVGDTTEEALAGIACGTRADLRHSRELFVLTRTRLAKWVVSRSQAERREYSVDVVRLISQAASSDADVHVLDVAATHAGDACVLAMVRRGGRERLAVAMLRSGRPAEPDVVGLWTLAHVPADGVPAGARVVLPDGGPAIFVVLRQTVLAAVVATAGVVFEAPVTLRADARVLAHGSESGAAMLLCAGAGVLRVGVDVARVLSAAPQAQPSAERECQSQLEQAVFFGSTCSPLAFPLASQAADGDAALEAAALRVSQAILDNTSHFITDRMDLGAHLRERHQRARAVMQAISSCGLAERLSGAARLQLCEHAEKLAAAAALWEHQDRLWTHGSNAPSLLHTLASAFLASLGLQSNDPLRTFLRHHVAAVGDLLALLRGPLANSSGSKDSARLAAFEAGRIVHAALQPALTYRADHAKLYAADGLPPVERWTSRAAISDLLVQHVEGMYSLCRDVSRSHCAAIYSRIDAAVLPGDAAAPDSRLDIFDAAVGAALPPAMSPPDGDPYTSPPALLRAAIDLVPALASLCFRVLADRIACLHSTSPADAHALARRYDAVRPRFLMCLVPLCRAPAAFRLAEEYSDMRTLVALVFAADLANAAPRLRTYTLRFGRDFDTALLAFYERRRAWASLLRGSGAASDVVLKDFVDAADPHSATAHVGWIHDVKIADYGAAAARLARAGRDARDVSKAHTMLSLSKLAFAAVAGQDASAGDAVVEARARLEDALELCETQESLAHRLTASVVAHRRAAAPTWRHCDDAADQKAVLDAAMLTTSPELRHARPALYIVYCELVRQVWNGCVLAAEDMLDVLTFPDSSEQSSALVNDRHALAIDILSRASFSMPELPREAALRTAWRRVFLSDDWRAIRGRLSANVPDRVLRTELVNTQLYAALHSCLVTRELAHPDWFLQPADSFAAADVEYLVSTRLVPRIVSPPDESPESKPLTSTTSAALRKDYAEEDARLRAAIECGLDEYYAEILRIVSDKIEQGPLASSPGAHSPTAIGLPMSIDPPSSSPGEDERMDAD